MLRKILKLLVSSMTKAPNKRLPYYFIVIHGLDLYPKGRGL